MTNDHESRHREDGDHEDFPKRGSRHPPTDRLVREEPAIPTDDEQGRDHR